MCAGSVGMPEEASRGRPLCSLELEGARVCKPPEMGARNNLDPSRIEESSLIH